MITEVIVPQLDQAGGDVVVGRWWKREGDPLRVGDVLCELETSKANTEIEANADGILRQILVQRGEAVPSLTVLALIGDAHEPLPRIDPFYRTQRAGRQSPPSSPPLPPPRGEGGLSSPLSPAPSSAGRAGAPVAPIPPAPSPTQGGRGARAEDRGEGGQGTSPPRPAWERGPGGEGLPPPRPAWERGPGGEGPPPRLFASPRAKKLAASHGIDLTTVQASHPDGRIVEEDVQRVIDQGRQVMRARVEQAKARQVEHAWQTIPHFYMATTVDMTAVVAQKAHAGAGVTYTDCLALAIVVALRQVPQLNGHWLDGRLVVRPDINLGLVTQTERGLLFPVLRQVQGLSLTDIAVRRQRLVEQAHTGKLPLDALADGTFSLSNIGPGHVDQFSAIIYPPQVAILSVGSILPRPFVVDGALVVRPTATLTLGVDHRAADGRDAAVFLAALKQALEG